MAVGAVEDLSVSDEVLVAMLGIGARVFGALHTGVESVGSLGVRVGTFLLDTLPVDAKRLLGDVSDEHFSTNLRRSFADLWVELSEWLRELISSHLPAQEDLDENLFRGFHI